MPALGAVEPHGVGVVDEDGEDGHHALVGARSSGKESRVEARDVAVHGDRLAGLVEGGLGDGVVAREELELDRLTNVDPDVVGREC